MSVSLNDLPVPFMSGKWTNLLSVPTVFNVLALDIEKEGVRELRTYAKDHGAGDTEGSRGRLKIEGKIPDTGIVAPHFRVVSERCTFCTRDVCSFSPVDRCNQYLPHRNWIKGYTP